MRNSGIIRSDTVARQYRLSEPLAGEVVMQETRQALLRSWIAWLLFVSGLGVAAYFFSAPAAYKNIAFWILLGTLSAWLVVGRLAGPAIDGAAREKAERINKFRS